MVLDLLSKLSGKGIKVKAVNDDLNIDAPKGSLTQEIINEIRQLKPAIIDYLKAKTLKEITVFRKAEKKKYYKLSSAQLRMFLINQIDKSNLSYNMVTSFPVDATF